jgi:hypothetical protein
MSEKALPHPASTDVGSPCLFQCPMPECQGKSPTFAVRLIAEEDAGLEQLKRLSSGFANGLLRKRARE